MKNVTKALALPVVLSLLAGLAQTRPVVAQPAFAPAAGPIVTVSFAGYDALKRDAQAIADLLGQPDAVQNLEAMIAMATQGQGLAGLDKTRPWGVVINSVMPAPSGYAFVPVTDLAQLVGLVVAMRGGGQPPQPMGGVYQIPVGNQTVFIAQKGSWALLSTDRAAIDKLPADPTTVLGGTEKEYLIALQVLVKNVPAMQKQMLLAMVQAGAQAGQQQRPGEKAWQYALRRRMSERSLRNTQKTLQEVDTLTVGLAVDPSTKNVRLDYRLTAVPGTEKAQQFAALADAHSEFGGFFQPAAALTAHGCGQLAPSDIADLRQIIAQMRKDALADIQEQPLSGEEKSVASEIVNQLLDVLDATVEKGRFDGGGSLLVNSGAMTLVAGCHIEQGDKLDQALRRVLEMVSAEDPNLARAIKTDADKHGDVSFHTVTLPGELLGPEGPPPELFGGQLTLAVGVGPQTVCFGLGANALEQLKAALDHSQAAAGQTVAPFRGSLSLKALAGLIKAAAPEAAQNAAAAGIFDAIAQTGSDDHVTLTSTAIPAGVQARLEVEQGVIKVIPALVEAVQAAVLESGFGPGEAIPFQMEEKPQPLSPF